ncbi:hypothetical protein [Lacrimispora brassicae]
MSYQDIAKNMIDKLPDDKMIFVINILENIGEMSGVNVYPEFTPNAETMEAMAEVEEMARTGKGNHFPGSTADFLAMLEEE